MLNISGFLNVKRYIVLFFASFAAGILFSSFGGTLLSFLPKLIFFTAAFITVFILIARCENRGLSSVKIIIVVLTAALGFSLGALRCEQYDRSHLDTLAPFEDSHSYIYGTVMSEPKLSKSGFSRGAVLDLYKIENSDGIFEASDRIMLYFNDSENEVHKGDSVYGIASLSVIRNFADFDYRKYMKQKEIFYSGYSRLIHTDTEHTAPFSLKNFICDYMRYRTENKFKHSFGY